MNVKILLVDDEQEYIEALAERLELRGLTSDIVFDGESALLYLSDHEPAAVVLDINMPGIDGIETLQRIKRSHPHIPVIISTGHGSAREERAALQLGAVAYFQKPTNIEVLSTKLREAIQR